MGGCQLSDPAACTIASSPEPSRASLNYPLKKKVSQAAQASSGILVPPQVPLDVPRSWF